MIESAQRLCKAIEKLQPNGQALIVGGAPRDTLLKREIHDVDIATSVNLDIIEQHFPTHEIGQSKDFGILVVKWEDQVFEVAHFRSEEGTLDQRHPENVTLVNSFEEDAARRDITINALGLDAAGNLLDPTGGFQDLMDKTIRAVGNPTLRIQEDALRILRMARFAAILNFTIEEETMQAMREQAVDVLNLPIERIQDEIMKTAKSGPALANFILLLDDIGLLIHILPWVKILQEFEHAPATHPEGGVFEHTIAALKISRSTDPITNIAILLHDIGKAQCREYFIRDEKERIRYTGHDAAGRNIFASQVSTTFKFSGTQNNTISWLIEKHMLIHKIHKMTLPKMVAIRQDPNWERLVDLGWADDACRGEIFSQADWDKKIQTVNEKTALFGAKEEFKKKMASLVNGNLVLQQAKAMGVEIEGPTIGSILKNIKDWIVEQEWKVSKEMIKKRIQSLLQKAA